MKRFIPILVLLLLVLAVGVAYAKPGDGPNSQLVLLTCGGETYDLIANGSGVAGHLPDGTIVKPRSNTGVFPDGSELFLYEQPGEGYQTVECTWTIPGVCPGPDCPFASFYGDIQFSPPK